MKKKRTSRPRTPEREIYLVRHAIAEERGPKWPDDRKRPLTGKGIERMREVVRGLRELAIAFDTVLSSPLVRAKDTAHILVGGMKPQPMITLLPALAPGTSPAQAGRAIQAYRQARRIAVVAHEPGLGELAAWLIGAKKPFELKKGGVCRIDVAGPVAAGKGRLVWLAPPGLLRKIS